MRQKMEEYENKIRMRYQTGSRGEKAHLYNKGYIMGLNDANIISTSEGMQLIDLNGQLREKFKS